MRIYMQVKIICKCPIIKHLRGYITLLIVLIFLFLSIESLIFVSYKFNILIIHSHDTHNDKRRD